MYENQPVPLRAFHEDDGTNSPLDHQRVISRLTFGLGLLYYQLKTIRLEPLPETPLDDGPGHSVPDLILLDPEAGETRIIIEICTVRGAKADVRKVIRLIEDEEYGILEGFVYNYRTHEWFRYRKGDGGLATPSAISEVLGGIDLAPMVA
jgi:hypothetical protein